ncbi:carbohydrate-binding family 9-like protein [Cohnella abietis]|uniref:Carbohydrate-binding domain-containing protein n=1 Tax=Cohnella abietis TaxID=2507935 RepID=A0A3T1CZV1_9BACL|nr:carbohydrate-binding family 9-like protein [Cohnella abietis]BBI31331.1 hypothetical protein KCTCHS21_07300 [Cohnella abietis]
MKKNSIVIKHSNDDSAAIWSTIDPLILDHHLWPDNDYKPEVKARIYYSSDSLHIQFQTYEDDPTITYFKSNDPVCRDSCVEFFFQPVPALDQRYLNFELNAAGTLLLGLGTGRNDLTQVADMTTEIFQIKPATGLTDSEFGRRYWELEFRIPFTFISSLFPDFEAVSGAVMSGNFYKCGDDTPAPHYLSWNLVTSETPDFHRSSDFGQIIFGASS